MIWGYPHDLHHPMPKRRCHVDPAGTLRKSSSRSSSLGTDEERPAESETECFFGWTEYEYDILYYFMLYIVIICHNGHKGHHVVKCKTCGWTCHCCVDFCGMSINEQRLCGCFWFFLDPQDWKQDAEAKLADEVLECNAQGDHSRSFNFRNLFCDYPPENGTSENGTSVLIRTK